MDSYGIVLGGGGTKGSYEIGVWKALRDLAIPIKAVTGTSVGALNGALIVQNDFDTAYKLWTNISIDKVISGEIASAKEYTKNPLSIASALKNAVSSGGLDITPLKKLLYEIIDEKKIRESPIDLGIVTFSLTDFKPIRVFKDDIPHGKLVDYLIASASFPAFKRHEIDNKKFIDGGVYDNVPISLMMEKNLKNIIAVDISGPGMSRKVDSVNTNIIHIKNSRNLGFVLDFDRSKAMRNMEIGYNDTMRAFERLQGVKYYIIPPKDKDIKKHAVISEDLNGMYHFLGLDDSSKLVGGSKLIMDKIAGTLVTYAGRRPCMESLFRAMVEITAEQIGINRDRVYTLDELVDLIIKEYESIQDTSDFIEYMRNINSIILRRKQLKLDSDIKKALTKARFLIYHTPYLDGDDEKVKHFRRFIALVSPKVSIANMFITLILSKHGNNTSIQSSS